MGQGVDAFNIEIFIFQCDFFVGFEVKNCENIFLGRDIQNLCLRFLFDFSVY